MTTKFICFLYVLMSFRVGVAQDLCEDGIYEHRLGYIVTSSTTLEHIIKKGIYLNLTEYQCYPEYNDPYNNIYTVNQQVDLLYFETYYDSAMNFIRVQGYYRLTYLDAETGYCWQRDLVWNSFDRDGYLIKKEYFDKGDLKETPTMPQPIHR